MSGSPSSPVAAPAPAGPGRAWWWAAVVAVGVLLAAEGAWSITRERHLSQDSMVYIHAARNVLLGRGVVLDILYYPRRRFPADFDFPQLYTLQPPLYPLAIAGVARG